VYIRRDSFIFFWLGDLKKKLRLISDFYFHFIWGRQKKSSPTTTERLLMVAPFIFLLKEIYQFAPVKHDMRVCLLRRGKMYLPVSLVNVEEVYGGRPS
jgi:hypothetical protein